MANSGRADCSPPPDSFRVLLHEPLPMLIGHRFPLQRNEATVSRRVLRRLQAIDGLPKRDQDALFRTIDVFLQARKVS